MFVLQKLKGTYLFCPRCGSPAVSHGRPEVAQDEKQRSETYKVKCGVCGLDGKVCETWNWGAGHEG